MSDICLCMYTIARRDSTRCDGVVVDDGRGGRSVARSFSFPCVASRPRVFIRVSFVVDEECVNVSVKSALFGGRRRCVETSHDDARVGRASERRERTMRGMTTTTSGVASHRDASTSTSAAMTKRRRRCALERLKDGGVARARTTTRASSSSTTTRTDAERRAEEALVASMRDDDVLAGFTKAEWAKIQTPARYLGNEVGAMLSETSWNESDVRFVMAYPEIYEVGSSNLGHIVLYTVLNKTPRTMCDRCYLPADDMISLLKSKNRALFAVESKRPLAHFDAVGLSVAYELGAINILEMMHLGKIPLTSAERDDAPGEAWNVDGGSWPMIFAGGPTATSNPEPFAEFLDFVALGDGEDVLPEIAESLKKSKLAKLTREETLYRLACDVEGVYVPRFYDSPAGWGGAVFPIREGVPARPKRRVATPDPMLQVGLVPYVETVHDRMTVEIRRGCTRGCRFCQPGMLTRPARDVDPERVVQAVEEGIRKTGYNEFSLLSLSCSDYLALPSVGLEIKNRLKDENVTLSLPSQRIDRFDDSIADILGGGGKVGLTFAPEAGTQRLRDIINKGLTNEELLRGVQNAYRRGWRNVKLYFMIGLPGELDSDVLGIAETVGWLVRTVSPPTGRKKDQLTVTLTISNFTPKPHTPFQWHSVSTSEFERKSEMLRNALKGVKGVKANYTSVRISAMEDFLGRGDRSLTPVLKRAWELGAHRDTWWDGAESSFKSFDRAVEESGMGWKYRQVVDGEWDVMDKLGDERYRGQGGGGKGRIDRGVEADKRLDAPLPWDHIDTGISKTWLKTDLQKALEGQTVPDCSHSGICTECGVCGGDFGENVVAVPPPIPAFEGHHDPDGRKTQRLRFTFTKKGQEIFIGHLDMLRLLERAARRAALPVSTSLSPYSSRLRISTAMPLPLGASSQAELLEIILVEPRDPKEVAKGLERALPEGMRIKSVEEIPVTYMNKTVTESMNELLTAATFIVHVAYPGAVKAPEIASASGAAPVWDVDGGPGGLDKANGKKAEVETDAFEDPAETARVWRELNEKASAVTMDNWRKWVRDTVAMNSFEIEKTSKRGRRRKVDLRTQLINLEVIDEAQTRELLDGDDVPIPRRWQPGTVCLKFTGEYTGAGGLSVDGMLQMLSSQAGATIEHLHSHRTDIHLREMVKPPPDRLWLTNMVRTEAFMALERRDPKMKAIGSNRGYMGGSFDDSMNAIDNHKSFAKR